MVTARRTHLLRVPDLRAFRSTLVRLALEGSVEDVRARAVIVPSAAAAEQLRRTIERDLSSATPCNGAPPNARPVPAGGRTAVLPDLPTRDEWYRAMHARAGADRPLLSRLEREVLAAAAARDAIEAGAIPPFRPRAALVSAILDFYDAVRRHRRGIDDFERLVVGDLTPRVEIDRGAERMMRQTRFFVAMLRAYESRAARGGALDEHSLRERLLGGGPAGLYRHVVVAVGDRQSDPPGLWEADFDLLTRLPGLAAIDVVATEASLAAGFRERVGALLPGVEERTVPPAGRAPGPPLLEVPAGSTGARHFVCRDREAELTDVARAVKSAPAGSQPRALDRTAVIFRRPLPYVYLARTIFDSARVPYEMADAFPLAAEPYAAALDLVFTAVTASFSREALIALMRSPQLDLAAGGDVPARLAALDRALEKAGFSGAREVPLQLSAARAGPLAELALVAARTIDELAPLAQIAPASAQLDRLAAFLQAHERMPGPADPWFDRHHRARAAILGALVELAAAHRLHDDPPVGIAELAATVRRWIEAETFAPRTGLGGVQLMDAHAAPFADLDEACLVGLVAGEWPAGMARDIFYPSFLLQQLGWPPEAARLLSSRAAFADLLGSPLRRVAVSAFLLEDDAIVEPSPLLEELDQPGLETTARPPGSAPRILRDEALSLEPIRIDAVSGPAAEWAAFRAGRDRSNWRRFRGWIEGAGRAAYKVTALDRYLDCPFRYFASEVLGVEEPQETVEGLSRREEGRFVHEVLRAFFAEWQRSGRAGITPETIDEARVLFRTVAERKLQELPGADRLQASAELFGTPASQGIGEAVLGFEAGSGEAVAERLLEHTLDGEHECRDGARSRSIALQARADRIDLLEGGRVRVIDYKLGKAASAARSIQLPVYALLAVSELGRRRGGRWKVAEARYLAFGLPDPVRTIIPSRSKSADPLGAAERRVLEAVEGIDRGEFPPRPADLSICRQCGFARVCRKEYVVDVDADPAF